ncbi:MAG: hypothetical protein IJT87_06845 [Ruminiclostridium sp.]|nr:hypothetical protein [Ruminiclostridium sp.]
MSAINTLYDSYSNAPVNSARSNSKVDDKSKSASDETAKTAEQASSKRTDSFEHSGRSVKNNTYTKGIKTEYTGKSELAIKNEAMKDMVQRLINKQAGKATGKDDENLSLESIMKSYDLDYIESDGSEDFWGAEKTANRILDFAKSLAGNDPKAFETVKNAFQKGFGECKKIWGGELPGVCNDTYDRVMSGFDEWEKELNGMTDEIAAAAQ